MTMKANPDKQDGAQRPLVPVEVEIYVNPDGSVTFADLEASLLPVAEKLNPDLPTQTDEDGVG